jgi:hypothetical protein
MWGAEYIRSGEQVPIHYQATDIRHCPWYLLAMCLSVLERNAVDCLHTCALTSWTQWQYMPRLSTAVSLCLVCSHAVLTCCCGMPKPHTLPLPPAVAAPASAPHCPSLPLAPSTLSDVCCAAFSLSLSLSLSVVLSCDLVNNPKCPVPKLPKLPKLLGCKHAIIPLEVDYL